MGDGRFGASEAGPVIRGGVGRTTSVPDGPSPTQNRRLSARGCHRPVAAVNLALLWALVTVACYRVTRLVVEDTIWEDTRDRLITRLQRKERGFGFKVSVLLGCPFCVSVWVASAAWVLLWIFTDSLPLPWLWWPAIAGSTALVYEVLVRWPEE